MEGELIPCTLPHEIARLYLYGLTEERRGLKPPRGITQAPILEEGGGIRAAQGYDSATGLYCHNLPQVLVPETLSEDEALDPCDSRDGG
jgi:hypothetical protein